MIFCNFLVVICRWWWWWYALRVVAFLLYVYISTIERLLLDIDTLLKIPQSSSSSSKQWIWNITHPSLIPGWSRSNLQRRWLFQPHHHTARCHGKKENTKWTMRRCLFCLKILNDWFVFRWPSPSNRTNNGSSLCNCPTLMVPKRWAKRWNTIHPKSQQKK